MEVFEWNTPTWNIDSSSQILYKIVQKYVNLLFFAPLAHRGVITKISEKTDRVTWFTKRGIISNFRWFYGYFQSESFFTTDVRPMLKIRQKYLDKATDFLKTVPTQRELVTVHIRRQDYLEFFDENNQPLVLPKAYYMEAIRRMKEVIPNPHFLFVSDDPDFVKSEFSDLVPQSISYNDVGTDLAIMTLSKNLITSNSSLSWWGANLGPKTGKIFAPEYWLGWTKGIWDPPGINPSFAEVIPRNSWT